MSRLLTVAGGLIAALAIATLTVTASAPGAGRPLYLDRHASIESRVNDLLHRMTLEEKVVDAALDRRVPVEVERSAGSRRGCGHG